jgi:4-amino-4-deoxy-L-arabinose transferase
MTTTTATSPLNNATRTAMLLVVLAYILIYLLPLGLRPLSTPDETRYGEIPHEMIKSGDWAVPHLVGLRYFEKPPLGYWLNAVSLKVFGENNFAVRLPSALAAGLSAWFIWLLLIRLGYPQRTALTTAAVYLSFIEVLIVGTVAVLDTPFSLFMTGGMVLFYLGANDPEQRRRRAYLISSGIFFGLAFLTKGFLALVLPGMVLFVYALMQKRYSLLWTSLVVAAIGVLTILPWAIIIHIREPDFWRYFFWEEHIRRFLEPNAQHPEPMYFFALYFPAMAFPWVAFLPAAISGLRQSDLNQRGRNADLLRYILLWFILPFIFFSISRGKLTTYILPVFAPTAVFIATGVVAYLKSNKTRLFTLGAAINTALVLLVLAIVIHQQYFEKDNALFSNGESQKMAILLFCIVLTAAGSFVPIFIKTMYMRIAVVSCTVVPLFAFINLVVPHSTLAGRSPIAIIEKVQPQIAADAMLVTDTNVVRAVAWTLKRTDIYLLQKGELTYGLTYPDAKGRYLGMEGLSKLLQQHDAGEMKREIAVFCEEPCHPGVSDLLKQHGAIYHSDDSFAAWIVPGKPAHE